MDAWGADVASVKQVGMDVGLVAAGWSAPWWLAGFEGWAQAGLLAGGLILLALRIWVAWRDIQRRHIPIPVEEVAREDEP